MHQLNISRAATGHQQVLGGPVVAHLRSYCELRHGRCDARSIIFGHHLPWSSQHKATSIPFHHPNSASTRTTYSSAAKPSRRHARPSQHAIVALHRRKLSPLADSPSPWPHSPSKGRSSGHSYTMAIVNPWGLILLVNSVNNSTADQCWTLCVWKWRRS